MRAPESLLCIANFPANTGYAWAFIESLYAQLADDLRAQGVRTYVAYPAIDTPPASLRASSAEPVRLEFSLTRPAAIRNFLAFLRRERVRALYLCDQPSWHPAYLLFRLAGVRRIVLHDHTSGERTVPRGIKRVLKRIRMLLPGMVPDRVVAVSDYVATRKLLVDLLPVTRISRVWNSVPDPGASEHARAHVRSLFGIAADRPIIACACRATREKGVGTLLRAFDRMQRQRAGVKPAAVLLYIGHGPAMPELQRLRNALATRRDIIFAGKRDDAAELMGGADLCVVPSLWQEAFGLAALEPMVRGVPVVASRVGGIPEVIGSPDCGRLVDPGDEAQLAAAMAELLADPNERLRLGRNARSRALRHFTRDTQIARLYSLVEPAFS